MASEDPGDLAIEISGIANGTGTNMNGTVTIYAQGQGTGVGEISLIATTGVYIGSQPLYFGTSGSTDYIQYNSTSSYWSIFTAASEQARFTGGNLALAGDRVLFQNAAGTGNDYIQIATNNKFWVVINGVAELNITDIRAYIPNTYSATTSVVANLNVTSGGYIRRSTSTMAVKENVELLVEHPMGKQFLKDYSLLMPVAFDSLTDPGIQQFGFIHEWSHGRLSSDEKHKEIDPVAYLALTVAKVQELETRLEAVGA